jgi:uncharacterized Zn-finger protein
MGVSEISETASTLKPVSLDSVEPATSSHPLHQVMCKICKKNFNSYRHLKRHSLVHENKKQYKCIEPGCGEEFNRIDVLRKHRKLKHRQKEV